MNHQTNSNTVEMKYDPALFMLHAMKHGKVGDAVLRIADAIPPASMYEHVRACNPFTWFNSDVYVEMLDRYRTIDSLLAPERDMEVRNSVISCILPMWREIRPLNRESLNLTLKVILSSLKTSRKIRLASLTCPAYTIRREDIAKALIEERVQSFVKHIEKGLVGLRDIISEWDIYAWDSSGLSDETLRRTVHPNLLRMPDVDERLDRSWRLLEKVAKLLQERLSIKVNLRRYGELGNYFQRARLILDSRENDEKFLSKCIARIMRQGKEDYLTMGENIEDHRERFWNDSYTYASAMLKYGMGDELDSDLSIMILIESRLHHVTGMRLYSFEVGDSVLNTPIWSCPSSLRSFYWANIGNDRVSVDIQALRNRWDKLELLNSNGRLAKIGHQIDPTT